MSHDLDVFFSNRLEILYQQLKDSLFNSNNPPLLRRIVVVYGPAMKSWLMLKMAQDPELNVAIGVEFITLNQAFEHLLQLTSPQSKNHLPAMLELNLAIEKELMAIVQSYSTLDPNEQVDWEPLIHYLKLDERQMKNTPLLTRKMERRLIGLSERLAHLFQNYGRYAGQMVAEWELPATRGWQPRLWRSLFGEAMGWTYPTRCLQACHPPTIPFSLHFFSISFITTCEFTFLRRLSSYVSVNYYLLSPCAVFWSDIRSDRENTFLQSHWQKKLGSQSPQLLQLEELLRDRNPLLANFGRLGREMACQIEESHAQTTALYVLPQEAAVLDEELFENDDLVVETSGKPLSLLHALQTDLLLMRNPQGKPPFDLSEEQASIQLHVAPNLRREIQILYHNLLALIAKNPDLSPNDIIVMAPQITEYVPYIQSLFGGYGSQLDYQILDLGMQTQSEIVQGFLQLFQLSESRWDSSQLLQLFEQRSFQRRHRLSAKDYLTIQSWIEQAGILWGDDWMHRNELLEKSHCLRGMVDETTSGTWDYGLTRLLFGLTTIHKPDHSLIDENAPACTSVDFSQAELMGKWIRILHSLRDDLTPLQDRTQMSMNDWAEYLKCLLENYFMPDPENAQSSDEFQDLKAQFDILSSSSAFFKEAHYSFVSVKSHLQSLLQQRGLIYRENQLQAIRFCSLVPLRSIPAKVIALLGMQEGAFPRIGQHSSLDLMAGKENVDYSPQTTDYDRYLFLEALHAAKDVLLLSCQGYHQKDGKELQPSLAVEELFSYLNKYYTIDGEAISRRCVFKHPFDAFDAAYFKSKSVLSNYSERDFQTAQTHQCSEKTFPHTFLKDFNFQEQPDLTPCQMTIELKNLTAVARNPIKYYLNKILEIYLQNEDDRKIKTEEALSLTPLVKYQFRQFALKEPFELIQHRAEKEGKLPLGLFKTVAINHLKDEFENTQERLLKHGIDRQEIFQIEFCTSCSDPIQLDSHQWLFPAMTLKSEGGSQISLIGKIANVTPQGLLVLGKGRFADAWRMWPQYLMCCHAASVRPDVFKPKLILANAAKPLESFFDDPTIYLQQFVEYYHLCQNQFSPLLPEWIPLIIKGDVRSLQDKMRQLYSDYAENYQNEELKWIFNKQALPSADVVIEEWKPHAELLAGDLTRFWFGSKSANAEVEK